MLQLGRMVLDAVSNFVRGNTDAAVGTSDTTVSVDDASIFPDPATDGEFNVVIWDVNNFPRPDQDGDVEIMRVTGRDTTADELTVTRGQEMTSAAAHPEGSAIHLSPTAKMFSDIESTFGDFWDAGTQELTADVNNTNTTTQALEAESVSTESLNNAVYASPTGYSVRDAVDEAGTGGAVLIETGTYDESGSNITVEDMTIIGLGDVTIDMGSNRLEVQGQSNVRDITVENNDSSLRAVRTMNGDRPVLIRVNTENEAENESIRLSADGSRLFAGTHIVPDGQDDSVVVDADDCMVMGNNIDSGIRDLGSDNYPSPFADFNNIF